MEAGLIFISLPPSAGRCPGLSWSPVLAPSGLPAMSKAAASMRPFRGWSAQMRWEGRAIVPPSPAFRFALWDAVHIKVVIEPPQSEIPVWQGSKVFSKRMRALTQHGWLKLPLWTAKRRFDSHKASIHLALTSTSEEVVYKHDSMMTKKGTFLCFCFLCLGG